MREQQSRPGDGTEAAEVLGGTPEDTGSDAGVFFRNSYAVLVRGRSVRRHLYFNLPGAQRAVERARARGDRADMVLVRLVPVDGRYLDGDVADSVTTADGGVR